MSTRTNAQLIPGLCPDAIVLPARAVADVSPPRTAYAACKMAVEWLSALILLVVLLPVILLAALLVKLTSRGPAFYTQARVGKDGRPFTIYKVRTMTHNCEALTGPRWAEPDDPRVTRVGAFLRRTHLDELPQLVNVLLCEMSLVGPRPERPEIAGELEREVPRYRARLLVRPGVTGLAQVQLPADSDLSSVRRKLGYDLYYVRHVGFWLDVRIVLRTACNLFGVPPAVSSKVFPVPGGADIESAYEALAAAAVPPPQLQTA